LVYGALIESNDFAPKINYRLSLADLR